MNEKLSDYVEKNIQVKLNKETNKFEIWHSWYMDEEEINLWISIRSKNGSRNRTFLRHETLNDRNWTVFQTNTNFLE